MFERESKREKNLEARAKELRNKKKQDDAAAKKGGEGDEEQAVPWENKVKEVEEEFWAAIQASDAKE
jgi:dynein intermediate chain 2